MKKFYDPFEKWIKSYLRVPLFLLMGQHPVNYRAITAKIIKKCVHKDNPIILEIGCNNGDHSLWLNSLFRNPTLHCFEPDPRAIERFKANVGETKNIHLHPIALSDHQGNAEFFQSRADEHANTKISAEDWDLSGSLRKPKNHIKEFPWIKFDRSIQVPITTLDSWCESNDVEAIDFIWMDVQGAEMDVIRGGKKTLLNTRFIYSEYSNKELFEGQATLKQLLKELPQFKIKVRYKKDVLLQKK